MTAILIILAIFLCGFVAGIVFSFKFLRGLFQYFTK
jgi:hypothetical protein